MQELQETYGKDGLVVLALTSEEPGKVEPYIEELGLTLPIGAQSATSGRYGVSGIPDAALIGPDGKLAWSGHPSSLSKSKVEEVLRGARKPAPGGYLAFEPSVPAEGALSAAVQATLAGELSRAYAQARRVADGANAAEADRENARTLIAELDQHVAELQKAAEGLITRLSLLQAIEVLERLQDSLKGTPAGDAARDRLRDIKRDERLSKELAAAEAFERLKVRSARLSTAKKRTAYEDFARKNEGTKAAERAMAFVNAKP